jgi:phage tail P2-like protein
MSLLPRNASALEAGLEAGTAAPALPVPMRDLWNPATCPEHLLPWLAWSLSVDNWDSNWPVAVRRAVCSNAIEVQRRKGTLGAVRRALAAFGASLSLREWFQLSPPGERGTFEVILAAASQAGAAPSAEFVDAVVDEIDRTKPLSRHFTFALAIDASGRVGLIGCARPAIYARLPCTA